MSNNSFDQIIKITETLGKSGDVPAAAGKVVEKGFEIGIEVLDFFGKIAQNRHNIKLQKLKNQLKIIEFAQQPKMQKIQNEHDEKMNQEQNRHEEKMNQEQEAMIKKQCEIFKVAIEAASAAYEKKIDFYTAQLNGLENAYSKQLDLLSEHIKFLENERRQYINDANKYALISTDISKLEEQKSELYTTYLKSQGNLEDAIKCLEIDQSFNRNLNEIKNNLIGRT
jgi:hypothetical protein